MVRQLNSSWYGVCVYVKLYTRSLPLTIISGSRKQLSVAPLTTLCAFPTIHGAPIRSRQVTRVFSSVTMTRPSRSTVCPVCSV